MFYLRALCNRYDHSLVKSIYLLVCADLNHHVQQSNITECLTISCVLNLQIREKERKIKEEQMPAITQAKRRQKLIANLPKLFNAIFFLYHKRTVVKREELLNKIITGSVDILDRSKQKHIHLF